MTIKEIAELFEKKQYMLRMGAGKLSEWLNCTKEEIYKAKELVKTNSTKNKFPKILIFDIETAPLEAEVFRAWKQNIFPEQITSEWFMLTWSAKWLFSTEIMSGKLTSEEAINQQDSRLVKELWELLDEADIVVAHHGDAFDVPKANTRFLLNGLPPTSPYQQIDTKKIATKQFGFTHNSLNGLAKLFGFDAKMDTSFELWSLCKKGNKEALEYMEKYNRYDVKLLEDIYLVMRPYIKSHPNVGLYLDLEVPVCSNCGSLNLEEMKEKFYYTQTGKFSLYRCNCGTIVRGRKTVQDKEIRDKLLIGLAR